ncbi:uncharacterized protein BJ171DRAFT_515976 [Polychytrium aggregatum]|uniref:uncharacterized protein n=1 Tax=Polychytrium aggregatum TaxID=110093 RepID=UPI0022FDC618|nr:uncharacterized protein BJ171DRAFT_515976 [Polychytrium aggregatum]KAI9201936.1 hypothetical protein BJ171DRAFT_515976 [Polychytrium aggregatum]
MTISQPSTLKLTYFDFTDHVEATRLSLHVAGIEFEDERISREQFLAIKHTLPFAQLPVLTVDGKFMFAQSKPILRYAGTIGGLYPGTTDILTSLLIDQIVEEMGDFWIKLVPSFSEPDEAKKLKIVQKVSAEDYPSMLSALDRFLAQHGDGFAVGDKLTIADLAVYCYFNLIVGPRAAVKGIPNDLLVPYSNISKVYKAVQTHPLVMEWESKFASDK